MLFNFRNAHNYLYSYPHSAKFKILFNDDPRRICDYFGVTKATAYRWINEGKPTNKTALRLLDIAASGFLPCNNHWNGFFIFDGSLVTSSGFVIHSWELDIMCETLERVPTAEKLINKPRNFKPWRDREPDFVKRFHSSK
ncbi:helix-turn-helix domain-containing protein [Shewanella psychrotolerans]|uniref:helix-turn-helix domain-containing protein n=1 Tax=Shewanella psychrotolerans TaxID=2864206 RepID=UPI001C6577A5|nr:helix-turn-helix domain-containing protein [Shewanella psychrotolerans]QYK03120.1 helix-turn-helix domain-containing protein [Shewanella psychrotolerans]